MTRREWVEAADWWQAVLVLDDQGCPVPGYACPRWRAHLAVAQEVLGGWLGRLLCRVRGHQWVEEGHAGPDSGWVGWECRRCGAGGRTVLY